MAMPVSRRWRLFMLQDQQNRQANKKAEVERMVGNRQSSARGRRRSK